MVGQHPCPCCGFSTLLGRPPGSGELCPVCGWEDDYVQFWAREHPGGANKVGLLHARSNFLRAGAADPALSELTRPPAWEEVPGPAH